MLAFTAIAVGLWRARAHAGLAHTHRALGNVDAARACYTHALALYTELGMPDADNLRTHLATLAPHPTSRR